MTENGKIFVIKLTVNDNPRKLRNIIKNMILARL